MNTLEVLKQVKTLSPDEIDRLLRSMRKPKTAAAPKKKPVVFSIRINDKLFQQTASRSDILKHFMEDLIPHTKFMPPYAIKAQIVSLFEMLAEAEDNLSAKSKWRQKASKVTLIDTQEHLFSYITNIATGIRM